MLSEASQNEIAAYEAYRGHEIELSGTVLERGLREKEIAVGRVTNTGLYSSQVAVSNERLTFGYVLLVPEDRQLGRAVCFFMPEDRADAGQVVPGQIATFRAYFTTFTREASGMFAQLDGCQLVH